MVTDRDIVLRAAAEGGDMDRYTARQVMSSGVYIASMISPLKRYNMKENQVRRLPVVNRGGSGWGAGRPHPPPRVVSLADTLSATAPVSGGDHAAVHVHVPAGAIPRDGALGRRDDHDGAGPPAAGAERGGHDGRNHATRQGASGRRDQGEGLARLDPVEGSATAPPVDSRHARSIAQGGFALNGRKGPPRT
jgi:CBS domain-containing protein